MLKKTCIWAIIDSITVLAGWFIDLLKNTPEKYK